MNDYHNEELKRLISESLRERPDSYLIQQLFERFPTKAELMDVSEQQLLSIKGIGESKMRQITSLLKLATTLTIPTQDNPIIRSPKDAFELLEPDFRYLNKEHFTCLFLNTKNRVIFKEIISIGSLNAAIVHPREVFQAALKRCSASIVCSHNHPSGDSTPSPEDIELTRRLVSVGEIVGIEVLDHIIIGGSNYVSLKEQGLM
ncbi:RadC family protein [Paenibacillus planticolens]|uniref:DNA repair protein RadC n=1 Tax=Paenibacillus planticolens TaxID=2654976 RepID=A0ABX1ZME0_9BACL|nr:DNA repair protein RadC [Paenibacillus planticolens]NOU99789.1 DNA repair protein RadC [Paenibacillus planticolens]